MTCRWYSGPTCNKCHGRDFRRKNPNYHKLYQRSQIKTPAAKERVQQRVKQRYQDNKEAIIEEHRIYQNERLKTDILFKLQRNLRSRLNKAVQGNFKTGSAVDDLGCSVDYLKAYLESKFKPGMTWDNWSRDGWHIDHIQPLSSAKIEKDLFILCHYTNLQPLWAKENLSKGGKYDHLT